MEEQRKTPKASRFEWAWCLGFVLLAAVVLTLVGNVLRPAHTAFGSTWDAYLGEEKNSLDVLFLGSSYAYCDWNPGALYDQSGLTSYVLAGGEQTVGVTYYYLKEALKTQSPQVVVLEGSSLFFDRYESFTQINVGYMPWGLNKVGAILEYAEPELRTGLFVDLIFYHDRWKELTRSDRGGLPAEPPGLRPAGAAVPGGGDRPDRHRQSHLSQYIPEVYRRLEEDVLERGATRFVNWADQFGELGLDPARHLYDGSHLNGEGAAVFSRYTGD